MDLLERISAEVDTRFKDWAFRGSLVDWHYLDGQVLVKDFDVVTSDRFVPDYECPVWGPRMSWRFLGRSIDVFYENPVGPRIQPIQDRISKLRSLKGLFPGNQQRYDQVLRKYEQLAKSQPMTCPHRGDQVRTMTSDLCGQRGKDIPVYSCSLHGECTHGQVCRGQDPSVRICLTCDDGPWAF